MIYECNYSYCWLRRNIIILRFLYKGAPDPSSPILDPYDCNGENPYQIEEVLEKKVWRVGYSSEQFFYTSPKNREEVKTTESDT